MIYSFSLLNQKQAVNEKIDVLVPMPIYNANIRIVNAYCQFFQQACTNFMQTYLYLLISTHLFILMTNLHWYIV